PGLAERWAASTARNGKADGGYALTYECASDHFWESQWIATRHLSTGEDIMKVDLEKLINKGFYRLPCDSTPLATSEATSGHKTVVILSPPRSCSSLVAGVLSKLGVFMGDKASSIVFEDTALAQHLEGGSSTSANALIENYN